MMQRGKGQLSRADLLQALHIKDGRTAKACAELMGLHQAQESSQEILVEELKTNSSEDELIDTQFFEKPEPRNDIARPKEAFWYLKKRETLNKETLASKKVVKKTSQPVWRNRPQQKPKHRLLTSPNEFITRLQPYLQQAQAVRKVDTNKIVKTVSRGQHLKQLPRKNRKRTSSHIHVIDDRHLHLVPYWLDHYWGALYLEHTVKACTFIRSVMRHGEDTPRLVDEDNEHNHEIPKNSTVLVLSDLGALAYQNAQQIDTWLKLGRRLQHKQCKVVALLPCERERVDPRLQTLYQCISWQGEEEWESKAQQSREEQQERFLNILSPSIRVEPSLIREMRIAMYKHGEQWQIPADIESLVWQHPDLEEKHSVAASWSSNARKQRLQHFSDFSDEEKNTALAIIRKWRGELSEQVWFEEISSLDSESQTLPCITEDVEDASHYFELLGERFQQDDELEAAKHTQAWFKRLEHRIPETKIGESAVLQRLCERTHKDDEDYKNPQIDPRNLPKNQESLKQAILYQQGQNLYLSQNPPPTQSLMGFSPLASISLKKDHVQIKVENQAYDALNLSQEALPLPGSHSFKVITDVEVLEFSQFKKPNDLMIARDQYGLYLDLKLKNITQRFRYIEPGTFLMGSPEDEPEREPWFGSKETQHPVTLTQGYWMADTVVTQAFYQAVTGNNPSKFKDDLNTPVERVSWDDTQTFIKKLNQLFPDLRATLPTEAQWEYACRAGTTTPFSFGDNISPEQVNYNGEYPYDDGERGLYREKTIAVKSLSPNSWGLYEMHGNVWEWCVDVFKEDLGKDAVQDPQEKGEADALRVFRGGSWSNGGRYVRSAYRFRYTPVNRDDGLGFRLLLGHVSSGQDQLVQSVPQYGQIPRDEGAGRAAAQIAEPTVSKIVNKIKDWFR